LRDGVYGELAPRQVNPVDRIAASAAHLRHLVDQILDIAKMAAGRMEMHPEPVDLRPFVIDVASEFEALIADRGLNLSLAIGGSLPRVRTDPTHLRQIIVNLLGNAVKYTPTGGIAIRARVVDERSSGQAVGAPSLVGAPQGGQAWIALQIADSGIGIAPADLVRVFEEFEQVNAGPRGDSMHRGTGLGLPISRRLARLLGGDIAVESELGKGSTFTVWIPVDSADLAARMGSQTPTAVADAVPTVAGR
jgi:signal transduction histidine kinase